MSKLSRALSLPPRLIAGEASWRAVRTGVRAATDARDRVRGPRPSVRLRKTRVFLVTPVSRLAAVEMVTREEVARCLEEAEEALAGRFRVLGFGALDFGSPPRWDLDPVSGERWPLVHHRLARPSTSGGEIRVPWDASRFHWLVSLARANAYRPDPRFVSGAGRLLDSWRRANPVGWGANWASPMEAGVRAINLAWAAEIFEDPSLSAAIGGLLASHGRFVLENIEYSPRLTSNHYLGDLIGLLHAGGALGRPAWIRFAWWSLQREIRKQFLADGANFEAATGYQRVSAELALLGLVAGRRLGLRMDPRAEERLHRAILVLAMLTKPDGRIPAVGDDDGQLAVNLSSGRDPRDPGPLLDAAGLSVRADRSEFASWLVGRSPPWGPSASEPRSAGGFHVLRDADVWCLVDCGGVGQRGNGGHAHNDTLSFVLSVRGRDVVVDPGTYVYTSDPAARNRFRATRAHATVEIDGEEINRFDERLLFTMHDEDRPVVELAGLGAGEQMLVARHEGYRRLTDPLVHRRTFRLAGGALEVEDELRCSGRHHAVVTLPLAPGAVVEQPRQGPVRIVMGEAAVVFEQVSGALLSWSVERGEVSPGYGAVVSAPVLRARLPVTGDTRWAFRFLPQREGGT